MVDLWADEPLDDEEESQETLVDEDYIQDVLSKKNIFLNISDDRIYVYSKKRLLSHEKLASDLSCIYGLEEIVEENYVTLICRLTAVNSFVFRHILKPFSVSVSQEDGELLASYANKIRTPRVILADTGKHLDIVSSNVKVYFDLFKKIGAYPVKTGFRTPIHRLLELETMAENLDTMLPSIQFDEDVLQLVREPIPNFDGTIDSLKNIPLSALNVVSSDVLNNKQRKASKGNLEDRLNAMGFPNLYELLFSLPKRFIDKSNPVDLSDVLEGENVTITGVIDEVDSIPNNMGISFILKDKRGTIKTNFWRQHWLSNKFKEGDEVLVTGKASRFRGKIEISGASIEHIEEAALIPILPIYKQAASKGVTSAIIMSANRELLKRAGELELPPYLRKSSLTYSQALTELHFPSSLENFNKAFQVFAYYELVYAQLLLLEEKANAEPQKSVPFTKTRDLQKKAISLLPFNLTPSQEEAISTLNDLLEEDSPTQSLLNADVGAGKSLVAQLAALRAVESRVQAVFIAPTELLAAQLFETLERLVSPLRDGGENISTALLRTGMKAAEKKPLINGLKDGSIDIVVSTTAALGAKVSYKNLGLVIIDEQQKFGAEQRSKLLNSRSDDLVPHVLLMSATPIPRSVAQIFYGNMTSLELKEKPPGRLPITTEWIQEDPIEFTRQITNSVWTDVISEAEKGNQTFIITPMVEDSDRVDAASVEASYGILKDMTLSGLNVGYVHGRMKKDDQAQVMQEFREKKLDVLVASTVVEVGVDIPDATRVVVLSADRLGASSLHQIRGRVGRNDKPSKCYLISLGKTESSQKRLQSLVDSENGFDIALADLMARGEGTVFDSNQSGGSEMIFASVVKHRNMLDQARSDAEKILNSRYSEEAISAARLKFENAERLV